MNESQMNEMIEEFRKRFGRFYASNAYEKPILDFENVPLEGIASGDIEDWIISQFQQYKASLLSQIEEMKNKHKLLLKSERSYNMALEDIKNKII